jgi:UDP-N-acetylmuramoyl-tripeptide--D-alanyl-D-alanine ligase
MLPMTFGQIATVTGGRVHDAELDRRLSGSVVIDSRQVQPGDIFAAFVGEYVDGHQFVADAVAAGAAAVIASRTVNAPAVVVPDVREGLTTLAGWVARHTPDTVKIGITGSSGKTSTKDLAAQGLARWARRPPRSGRATTSSASR